MAEQKSGEVQREAEGVSSKEKVFGESGARWPEEIPRDLMRDLFAMAALRLGAGFFPATHASAYGSIAFGAYALADAMLAEREKRNGKV